MHIGIFLVEWIHGFTHSSTLR